MIVVVNMINEPIELSSLEIMKIISPRYGFLMSFERVVRKRNKPSSEPSSPEGVRIISSKYGFLISFERVVRERNIPDTL